MATIKNLGKRYIGTANSKPKDKATPQLGTKMKSATVRKSN